MVAGVEMQNFYIPAGGDVPDRAVNAKFDHKLDFFERLTGGDGRARSQAAPLVIAGDLNVAPGEYDVWNHRHMLKVVSHTPVEIEAMERAEGLACGFIDLVREAMPEPEKLFSWWSYRAADFRASNRGLRLDHLWVSPGPAGRRRSARAPPPPASTTTSATGTAPATTPRSAPTSTCRTEFLIWARLPRNGERPLRSR